MGRRNQEAASAPSVGRNSPSGQTLLPDSDDRGIERLPEISVMEELFQKISQLTLEGSSPVEFVVQGIQFLSLRQKLALPIPLSVIKRSRAGSGVENHTRPQTDAAFIKAAKASWITDYPRAIGDPDDLIRRVFLQGLPRWIREAVVVKEEAELCNLVRLPREFGVSGKVKVLGSGVAATPSLASKEVLSTTDCERGSSETCRSTYGFFDGQWLQNAVFVDTGSEVAHVAVPAFVPPRSGRFVKCSVPRGMQAAKELMVSGIECPLVVPRSLQEYAAEEQALGTELFMGNDNDFELDVDLPPCSVVTQTPVGVDQSGSSTDCPEDVQLKDAELGDLLSEIDLGHLTLEQQQQLRQLSRAVAATELHNRDPDDLRRHQLEDPLWKEVIEYLEERNLPRRRLPLTLEEFELRDGVLYHVRHLPDRVLHQLVVPKTLRGSAMHLAHSSATAGHPGVYRTYCKLRDYFYFPNMLAAVKEYVGTCRSCQKRKGMAYRAPLAAAPQASYPLERVSADLMELEVTSQGNRYVLAFIDQLTRYVQLIPLPSKDAETVADAFINQFVTVFGPPRLLQTDNGREFKNNLFKRVCELASVQTIFTTAFHPQANGMIERTNRVVKNALATLLEASPLEWDELLPYVRLAMNSAVHRSVGDQPLYLLTGHIGTYPVGNSNYEETDHEAAQSFAARLRRAREIAVETSVQAREGWARIIIGEPASPPLLLRLVI
ncbi:pol polyprotein [Penaeus vannamei]|uniref:RNA-directed DNA polymerase n=1 Tax=Penaeus vannamei TaxID=6689 RepID=A0A3R7QPJ6_PENVA|nr:pol polyprotein [Penaeus vannamei]